MAMGTGLRGLVRPREPALLSMKAGETGGRRRIAPTEANPFLSLFFRPANAFLGKGGLFLYPPACVQHGIEGIGN